MSKFKNGDVIRCIESYSTDWYAKFNKGDIAVVLLAGVPPINSELWIDETTETVNFIKVFDDYQSFSVVEHHAMYQPSEYADKWVLVTELDRFFNLKLTDKELPVVVRLDLSNAEIAEDLNINVRTVEDRVERILKKLGVANRTAAALEAVRLGILAIPVINSESRDSIKES